MNRTEPVLSGPVEVHQYLGRYATGCSCGCPIWKQKTGPNWTLKHYRSSPASSSRLSGAPTTHLMSSGSLAWGWVLHRHLLTALADVHGMVTTIRIMYCHPCHCCRLACHHLLPSSPVPIYPRSTPRAVAQGAGGGWCFVGIVVIDIIVLVPFPHCRCCLSTSPLSSYPSPSSHILPSMSSPLSSPPLVGVLWLSSRAGTHDPPYEQGLAGMGQVLAWFWVQRG